MSALTKAIRDALGDASDVTDEVGTRIRRGVADKTDARSGAARRSFIVITERGRTRDHHQTGPGVLWKAYPTVHCMAPSRGDAETLSAAVVDTLDRLDHATMGDDSLDVRTFFLVGINEMDGAEQNDGSQNDMFRDDVEFRVSHL